MASLSSASPQPTVPSSRIRPRSLPLTPEELNDVRALVCVARKRGGGDEKDGGGHVRDASTPSPWASSSRSRPLTGRRVMIPMTSVAFFDGILRPDVDAGRSAVGKDVDRDKITTGDNCLSVDPGSELILMDLGAGYLAEMTRVEAFEFLERRRVASSAAAGGESSIKARAEGTSSGSSSSASSSSPSSEERRRISNGGGKGSAAATAADGRKENDVANDDRSKELLSAPPSQSALPFVEIRERCDDLGNVVSSEVLDMSDEMRRVEERLKTGGSKGGNECTDEGAELAKRLAQALGESAAASTPVEGGQGKEIYTDDDDTGGGNEGDSKRSCVPSDESYSATRARLEELERMEEEDERARTENAKSSKRLQSAGWSRGFLNSNGGRKVADEKRTGTTGRGRDHVGSKTDVSTSPQRRGDGAAGEIPSRGRGGILDGGPSPSKPVAATNERSPSAVASAASSGGRARVSFATERRVKEIPRIGRNKIPPKRVATGSSARPSAEFDDSASPSPSTAAHASFNGDLFNGAVRERPSSGAGATNTVAGSGEKKKLSRFAQQRLQKGR